MEELSNQQVEELGELLESIKADLTHLLGDDDGSSEPVTLDQTLVGRVSRVDAIQQQQMAKANKQGNIERLKRVNLALARIKEDDYGFCLSCDESIGYPRLHIQPEAAMCLACQEKAEQ